MEQATRVETVERWIDALDRADRERLTIRAGMFGTTGYVVSSSTGELSYATNGTYCGCAAAEHGDPVCKHRALALDIMGLFHEKLHDVEQRAYWN